MKTSSNEARGIFWQRLPLSRKALVIIIAGTLGLLSTSAIVTQHFVTEQYLALENVEVERALLNASNILDHEADTLSRTVTDWASWDDAYAFIQDRNENFIDVNLIDEMFVVTRINFVAFVSSEGALVYTKAFDLLDEEEILRPVDIRRHIAEIHLQNFEPDSQKGAAGIARVSGKFYLISSQPILRSDNSGPVRGRLIMGRWLSDPVLSDIVPLMIAPASIAPIEQSGDQKVPPEMTGISAASSQMSVHRFSRKEVTGSLLRQDLYGNAAYSVSVTMPRDTFQRGRATITQMLISILVAGVTIGLATLLLIRRAIVNPLTKLSQSVSEIRHHGHLTARVPHSGDDEIGYLAKEINRLLETQQISEAHLRQKEEQALVLSERAEAASQAKSQFLAMMSHELRTPLNSIIGFANLLNYTKINEEQHEFVETIQEGRDHLLALISNILDYTKLEADSVVFDVKATNLLGELQKVEREFRLPADQKGVELIVSATENVPTHVETDGDRMRQIVVILVDNAVKFTESGTVTIGADARWDTDEERWDLILTVTDTGIGIPDEKQESIFHLFEQAEPLLNRRYGGSGLGLAICRLQVERMGGTVSCRSTPGKGSRFIVTLPAGAAAPESVEQETSDQESDEPTDASPLRIIYVEDDPGSQAVMRAALSKLGHEVEVVNDSKQFCETIENRTFDLVILDLQLNGETGFELTARLREGTWGEATKDIYIVGISALALPDGQARSLESGMNDYIPKPISLQVLRQTIARARPRF